MEKKEFIESYRGLKTTIESIIAYYTTIANDHRSAIKSKVAMAIVTAIVASGMVGVSIWQIVERVSSSVTLSLGKLGMLILITTLILVWVAVLFIKYLAEDIAIHKRAIQLLQEKCDKDCFEVEEMYKNTIGKELARNIED
jgi:hypothetical protein